ncbi:uncharacterized protein LOC115455053 [Manduca sexta]|uniref:uncharacterized protein LOC115455053 n=1 Tax=Manduca sexta TaxID=7130 RepID=UPI0018905295|nr:uncharacterized protein LOC115455053 [Manduca sexta]
MPPKVEPRRVSYSAELPCSEITKFIQTIPKICKSIIEALRDGKSVTSVNKDYIEENAKEIMKATKHMEDIIKHADPKRLDQYFKAVLLKAQSAKTLPAGSPSSSKLDTAPKTPTDQSLDINSFKKDIVDSVQSVLEKHVQTINEHTAKQNKTIEEIKKQLSRPTNTLTPTLTQPRTYGAVAATPAHADSNRLALTRPKPNAVAPKTRPAIIITPKTTTDKTHTTEEIVKLFKKNISFRDSEYAPARVQAISRNKLRIEFDRTEERDDALTRLRNATDVRAEPARYLKPMVLLKGISIDIPAEQLTSIILKQNPNIDTLVKNGAEFQYRLSRDNRNPKFYNAAFITDPAVWRRITEAGRVCVDYQRVHAEDFSPFMQCFRCLQFGHTRAKCAAPISPCAHCASEQHCTAKCPSLEGPAKCYNCITYNKRFNNNIDAAHRATAASCPRVRSMKERILNRVDYGSP